jgi:hypothetical protein
MYHHTSKRFHVPVHHHLLQQVTAVVLLHGMQQQCRSCSVHLESELYQSIGL